MDQIEGVEYSFVNEQGNLLRLELRPGANAETVAQQAQLILAEEGGDRVAVVTGQDTRPLGRESAGSALRTEQWQESSEVNRAAVAQRTQEARRTWSLVWLLLVVGVAILVWRLWRKATRTIQGEQHPG
jgi:hypothetical protein